MPHGSKRYLLGKIKRVQATLILNFIAVILAAILLVFILIGMIAALKDVGDGGCCAMIFGAVCTLIIFGCAMVFQGTCR